jgi:DNA gyrase subunit A
VRWLPTMHSVDRIPHVHDGLDVLERRVVSLLGDRYVRCADIVHDAVSYRALVGLAQPFRRRYPLVDGRGNFGSVDADPPADARYTKARLAPIARALPRFPNLLVNGSGTIPPHNLREVAAAVIACIDEPDIDVAGLMAHMPGPDFPMGGAIVDPAGVHAAYETGTGAITLRARTHFEGDTIVLTELPYTVYRGGQHGVILQVAKLHQSGLCELSDLRDESDRHGMRLVVALRRDANPQAVLATLYAHTSLEITFAVDLVALVDGAPRRFTLRKLIAHFLKGRDPAVARRELHDIANRFGDHRRTLLSRDGDDG